MSTTTDVSLRGPDAGKGDPPSAPAGSSIRATKSRRRRRGRNVVAALGAAWLVLIAGAAVLAPVLPLPAPDHVGDQYSLAPFRTMTHLLGTDQLGRDQLSRVVFGAQVSLAVAVGATLLALTVGTAVGLAAGYFRGVTDVVFDITTNTTLAFPPLILLVALVAVMQPSVTTLTLGLGIVGARRSHASRARTPSRSPVVSSSRRRNRWARVRSGFSVGKSCRTSSCRSSPSRPSWPRHSSSRKDR